VLPPYPGGLPKGATRIRSDRLSVGDILFLETAASGAPLRSLILEIRGPYFKVMNRLHPDPYTIFLPKTKEVWALKIRRWQPKEDERDNPREPVVRTYSQGPLIEDDPRDYWNWDPKDKRAGTDFYSVEEKDWKRLYSWWEAKKSRQAQKPPPVRKIDPKSSEWYKLLNIRAGVTLRELKAAYKKAAFRYHPDRCKDSNAEEMFKQVSAAYQGLLALLERKKR
jgi:hypothetical protein